MEFQRQIKIQISNELLIVQLKYPNPYFSQQVISMQIVAVCSCLNTRDQNADTDQTSKPAASPCGYCINDITTIRTPKETHYTYIYIYVLHPKIYLLGSRYVLLQHFLQHLLQHLLQHYSRKMPFQMGMALKKTTHTYTHTYIYYKHLTMVL